MNRYLALVLIVLLAAHLPASAQTRAEDPETVSSALSPALQKADDMPRLYSLIIEHQGEVLVEKYFNGKDAGDIANVKSVSKSIIGLLTGAAIEQGYIDSVNQEIGSFFPELSNSPEQSAKANITIHDLLTMQSGLETTSNRNYGRWVLSDNWVDFTLNQPIQNPAGTVMQYSTGSTHLLSAIITKVTGDSTLEFGREALGSPLGFRLASWPKDPQGIYFGGNDMEFTPRQMLSIGEMVLNNGSYQGRQVLPTNWIESSLQDHTVSPRDFGRRTYGYGWWIRNMAGYRTTYAWGYGGQFIMIVKDLDLVIVATSSPQPSDNRRRHTRDLYNLLEWDIIASVATALGLPVLTDTCTDTIQAQC